MTQYDKIHSCLFFAEFRSTNEPEQQVLLKSLTNLIKIIVINKLIIIITTLIIH